MKEWFTLSDLAEAKLPDMPWTIKGYDKYIIRHGWRAIGKVRKREGREGGGERRAGTHRRTRSSSSSRKVRRGARSRPS